MGSILMYRTVLFFERTVLSNDLSSVHISADKRISSFPSLVQVFWLLSS